MNKQLLGEVKAGKYALRLICHFPDGVPGVFHLRSPFYARHIVQTMKKRGRKVDYSLVKINFA